MIRWKQRRSHQVWCGQVRSAYVSTLQLVWFWGMPPPPTKIFRLLLRPFLARGQSFTCMKIFPLRRTALVSAFGSDRSLVSQATPFTDEASETTIVRLEERKVVGSKTRKSSFALFAAISQVSRCQVCGWGPCVGVRRALGLIGDAK